MSAPENPERLWVYPVVDNGPGCGVQIRAYLDPQDAEESRDEAGVDDEEMGPTAEYVLADVAEREREAAVAAAEAKALPALKAASYLLDRLQQDADTYWILGKGSQAFYLLTQAEAAFTGKPLAEIEEKRKILYDKRLNERDELRAQLAHWQEYGTAPGDDEGDES